jgi:hypothetical protein
MGSISMIVGQMGYVDPVSDFSDSGWVISGGFAQHFPCNPGLVSYKGDLTQLGLITGQQYDLTYTVDNYVSGQVYPIFGAVNGTPQTGNVVNFEQTFTYDGNPNIQFYSDGSLRISAFEIAIHLLNPDNGQTLAFCEKFKKWSTYYSLEPENSIRYGDKLFSFKNGQLWKNNDSSVYNNFYGVQYESEITFYVNVDDQVVKNFFSARQVASSVWGSPNQGDIFILPYEGKPNGQQSRLKKGNYKQLQGDYFADFLRDMTDPRYTDVVKALFNGAELQGKIMQVTIRNDSNTFVRIVSMDFMTDNQNYSYNGGE